MIFFGIFFLFSLDPPSSGPKFLIHFLSILSTLFYNYTEKNNFAVVAEASSLLQIRSADSSKFSWRNYFYVVRIESSLLQEWKKRT